MPDISPIIKAFVSSLLDHHRPLISPATKTEWALLILIGLCAAADVFFLAMALYQYLITIFEPSIAALISAAVFFVVALLAAAIRKFITLEKSGGHKTADDAIKENIHTLMTHLFNELEEPIKDHPKTSMTIATLAGLLAGRRI